MCLKVEVKSPLSALCSTFCQVQLYFVIFRRKVENNSQIYHYNEGIGFRGFRSACEIQNSVEQPDHFHATACRTNRNRCLIKIVSCPCFQTELFYNSLAVSNKPHIIIPCIAQLLSSPALPLQPEFKFNFPAIRTQVYKADFLIKISLQQPNL